MMTAGYEKEPSVYPCRGKNKEINVMNVYNNHALAIFMKLLLVVCLLSFTGCAQSAYSVRGTRITDGKAVLQEIKVFGEGSDTRVEISANKPLTYTHYKIAEPPRVVIDLSLSDPGSIKSPIEINSSIIKQIEVIKNESAGGPFTRIIVKLTRNVEFSASTDPSNKNKLILSVARHQEDQKVAVPNKKETSPVKTAESLPVKKSSEPLTSVITGNKDEKLMSKKSSDIKTPSSRTVNPSAEIQPPEAPIPPAHVEKTLVKSDAPATDSTVKIINGLNIVPDGIEITANGDIDIFKQFKLAKPQRLVIDLFEVKTSIARNVIPIRKFGIVNARMGIYSEKIRIVFDSARQTFPPYKIERTGNGLKIIFTEVSKEEKQETKSDTTIENDPVQDPRKTGKAKPASIEAIDFRLVEGYSRITVKMNGECPFDEPEKTAEGLVLTFRNCLLPNKLKRSFDTRAFASNVKNITPYQVKTKGKLETKILVRLSQGTPHALKREDNTVVLDIKNPEIAETPIMISGSVKTAAVVPTKPKGEVTKAFQVQQITSGKKVYSGRRVTLEFADADIRKIFQLIAEVSNLNFLLGDDVTGTISIKLVNVPWDQALDVILETKGLGMKREGNIVLIRPLSKIQTIADEQSAEKRALERSMELHTKVFDVNFAAVSDIATQFNSLKSERGMIAQDARTNRVIVTDIPPSIEKMTALLAALDIPEKQVMIEARIVEASSTFTRDLGIQWGIHYKDGSASFLGINQLDTGFGGVVTTTPPTSGLPTATTAGGAMGLSFGKLTNNIQIDLRLSAAAETGQVKIISTPKVVTLNNKAAKISQGQSIPYQTTSAEGTKTEFVEAALTLEVTPHITADGNVSMKIKASNNSAGSAPAGIPPPINKKEATTELLVKNGETTVIGGIYVDNDTTSDSGVPYLMDIPLLGWLFKSNNKTASKTELLIFITPKIVS
jgi:type IV pilus assembly protein PilQ